MKNILKKLLILLSVCGALFCLLILLCALRPDLSRQLAGLLYSGEETGEEHSPVEEAAAGREEALETMPAVGDAGDDAGEGPEGILSENFLSGDAAWYDTYTAPEAEEVEAPAEVADRTGYQPVEDKTEQVGEQSASVQPDFGETGEGLSFDAQMYPYYNMLDDTLKKLYRQIYANASALRGEFTPVERVSPGQLKSAFTAVFNDHPELFWLESGYSCKYIRGGGCVEMKLDFNGTADKLGESREKFETAAAVITDAAGELGSDYEKELYVHDALNASVDYRLNAPDNQSAYSALVGGETVCAGYARAFQYLMQQLGIPCYYCTGYAGQNHAWNLVGLDDGFYNVDTTWDDTEPGTYDYFNRTDGEFAPTHARRELSVYLPACNGQAYRDLAQNPDTGRTLEEAGLTEADVLYSMEEYYADCYNRALQAGENPIVFTNVLEGEELWQQWQDGYNREDYGDGFVRQVLEALGGSSCRIGVEAEELQQDKYLLKHTLVIE